jgi:3D (Asp-Asp-Asp) domain-containing protein
MRLGVVRVNRESYIEEVPVAFEERWEPEPTMPIDERRITDWGREGAQRMRIRVVYENQQEVRRELDEEWIAREPRDRVIQYGTEVELRELETPDGTFTYWRKLRMSATSYNAPTAGKSPDHPAYAITKSGERARKGIIAVDPRIIGLGQRMYVPGYGVGIAADTGSAIQWRRIDLCYDDDNLVLWKRWVDAYLLAPMPPRDEINWIIPNTPRERE